MGLEAPEARIRAGSANAGIGETIAIGRVLYSGNIAIIPKDELWVPAKENVARFIVVPIGGIHIIIGKTANGSLSQETSTTSRPTRTAFGLETIVEDQSEQDLPAENFSSDFSD